MNRPCFYAGFVACWIAVLAMTGGFWVAMQSVAWARMLAGFVRTEPLGAAMIKTFDGRHPCALCIQVQKGWRTEQQEQEKVPLLKLERLPEMLWEVRQWTMPALELLTWHDVPFVSRTYSDVINAPLVPPPRS